MDTNMVHITEEDMANIKQISLPYLPRNLADVESQRQILMMIAQVVPEMGSYMGEADNTVWPKTKSKELSFSRAIAQCAYQSNIIIGSAMPTQQMLECYQEIILYQAWIALDYYVYILKVEYSVNIMTLRDRIAGVLLSGKTAGKSVQDYDVTRPGEETEVPVIPQTAGENTAAVSKSAEKKTRKKTKAKKKEKKKFFKKPVILAVAMLVVTAALAWFFSDTNQTKFAIEKIGTVTLDSEEGILRAEQRYQELTEEQRNKIENCEVLFAARAKYDSLVTDAAIEKIGKVSMESKEAIVYAEQLYEALSEESRSLLKNHKILTDARKEYDRLATAIKKTEDDIDAIGKVTLDSVDRIETARKSYDALKKDNLQPYLAGKLSVLIDAEKEYKQLKGQDIYETGMSHYENKSYEEAIACFDSIIVDYADTTVVDDAKVAKATSQIAQAEHSYSKRDYYTAMKMLEGVDETYRMEQYHTIRNKVVTAVTKARPRTGTNVAGSADWGYCYVKFTASNQDVLVKFQSEENPDKYKLVYVRAGEEAKVNLKDGSYTVKFATGQYWFDKDHLFGDDTVYKRTDDVDFDTNISGNWIYYWSYKLDMTDYGFNATLINKNAF